MRTALLRLLALALVAGPLPLFAQQDSLGEAARKLREKKKATPKATRTFTNDTLPSKGNVSVVGSQAAPAPAEAAGAEGAAGDVKDEGYWRKRFSELRRQLANAEKELDILQRELNLMSVQHYSDPTKALQEQFERKEINEHRKKLTDKQDEVGRLKQALTDLEAELRREGGQPAWARE